MPNEEFLNVWEILRYFTENQVKDIADIDGLRYSNCFVGYKYGLDLSNDTTCITLQKEIVLHYNKVLKVMKYTLQPLSFAPVFKTDLLDYKKASQSVFSKYTKEGDENHLNFRPLLLECKFGMTRENSSSGCSMFKRAFTYSGLAYIFNSASVKDIFRDNIWTQAFLSEMEEKVQEDSNNSKSLNLAKTLLNGPRFSLDCVLQVPKEGLRISLHKSTDIPDTNGEAFKVFPGTHTSVLVTPTKVRITRELLKKHPEQRQCYSSQDKVPLSIFKEYSRVNCAFECHAKMARDVCGCIPWDFPRWEDETPACTSAGTTCFMDVMGRSSGQQCRQCLPDCETVYYKYGIQTASIDEKMADLCPEFISVIPNTTLFMAVRKSWRQLHDEETMTLLTNYKPYNDKCPAFAKHFLASISVYVSPSFATRITKQPRVTFVDQLANLGKYAKK